MTYVPDSASIRDRALPLLARLISFNSVSDRSNAELISYVEEYLSGLGVSSIRIPAGDATKLNLWATIGPADASGGIVLSGHTDVVPVAGQRWTSDPFSLTRRGDRLLGRGTCDMKGFLALALAIAPDLVGRARRPVHLAFSCDEELGCVGAPAMINRIAGDVPRPALAIVGEPTNMGVISGHKGGAVYRVTVTGREAHSSDPTLGVSANDAAVGLLTELRSLAERLEHGHATDLGFRPPYSTLTIGRIDGGTAVNILARTCTFMFDVRPLPGSDANELLSDFMTRARALDTELRQRAPAGGVHVEQLAQYPAFSSDVDGPAESFVRSLIGVDGPRQFVSYGTEAGLFQRAGIPAVLCGPGSIDQAHRADEYLEMSQLVRGADFMARIVAAVTR